MRPSKGIFIGCMILVTGLVLGAAATPAQAQCHGGGYGYYSAPPTYYSPPPVYYAPPSVVYAAPAPVYYAPSYRGFGGHFSYRSGHGHYSHGRSFGFGFGRH